MKNIVLFAAIFLLGLSLNVAFAALPVMKSFGGRIITAPTPGITCPTSLEPSSPFTIKPVGGLAPGPYAEIPGPTGYGQVVPQAWIIGLYPATPIPDCVGPTGLVPVFKATLFGTSVPLPLPI